MRTRAGVLVGRGDELSALRAQLSQSLGGGAGSGCFCIGEPGVGKSRLLNAAAERAGRDGPVLVRGRASSTGGVAPLRPFAEAVASIQRRGLLPEDPLNGYRPLLARVLPELGDADAVGTGGSVPRMAFAEAMLRLLTRLGGWSGCLLVLEDLHDADPESVAVLEYLLDNIGEAPITVLGALRNEPSSAREMLVAAERRGVAELLPLGALDREHTELLMAACLSADRLPAELAEVIWRNSGGNPLAVEELLYQMVDSGQLRRQESGWLLPADPVLAAPPGMLELVGSRIDRMPAVARTLLVTAAVYGQHFPLAAVGAVVGVAERPFLEAVEVATAAQLITAAESPGWYRFHHPLIHEAMLELAGIAERRRAAGGLAEAVLAEEPEQAPATCRLAARLLADAGQAAAAGRLYIRAGRQALRGGAYETAAADLTGAMRLLPRERWAPELIADWVIALIQAAQPDRAVELVDTLGPPATGPDREVRAQIHLDLAWGYLVAWRLEKSWLQLARARALAAGTGSQLLTVGCDAVEVCLQVAQRDPAAGQNADRAREIAEAAERLGAGEAACRAWRACYKWLEQHGIHQESAWCNQRILAVADRHNLAGWKLDVVRRAAADRWFADYDELPMRAVHMLAQQHGAVPTALWLEALLALHEVLVSQGSLAAPVLSLTGCVEQARRLNQVAALRWALAGLVVAASFRADQATLPAALARFEAAGGRELPIGRYLTETAPAICQALQGQDDTALTLLEELTRRQPSVAFEHSIPHGLRLLLAALAGTAGPDEVAAALAGCCRDSRWSQQFLHWAAAVHAGRRGDRAAAAEQAQLAAADARMFPVPRHLAARLVAPAAAADGWGTPIEDLRAAEAWFHEQGIPTAARSCRDVLRSLGIPVKQHRKGIASVPSQLRVAGVTTREYEVSLLVRERLGNREIGEILHISIRTVEKHIEALHTKLHTPDRRTLIGQLARAGH